MSHELWTAYLNRGGGEWCLCLLAAEITCQPISAVPRQLFTGAGSFPDRVTDQVWAELSPISIPAGRYVLAGPIAAVGPEVVFEGISDGGFPAYRGPAVQMVANGTLWADIGPLGRGRYVAAVWDYSLSSADTQGRSTAELHGWGRGFIVGSAP